MELEEMKTQWAEMSAAIERQKRITDALIIKMMHADYRNKINKILVPETIGSLICFANIIYILVNFQQLNTWYLVASGLVAVFILILLPLLSMKAIFKMRSVNIPANNYKQSLQEYSKGKLQFGFYQKLSFYLCAILLLVLLPVMGKLMSGKDFFLSAKLPIFYGVGFIFFYLFASRVFKSYKKTTDDAENILKELND